MSENLEPITSFFGDYRFLSNFWPVDIEIYGWKYKSVEHAYQAMKTLDWQERFQFTAENNLTAGQAKRAGRTVTMRQDWDLVKTKYMIKFCQQKFQHPDLRERLAQTGKRELIEGNTWGDVFWGVDTRTGEGKNVLGLILMNIRSNILLESMFS